MLFLDMPGMPPQMTEVRPAYVAAETSSADYVGNFGYCMIANDAIGGAVDITRPFRDLIPRRILRALEDSERLGVSVLESKDEVWLSKWQESFVVKVMRQPKHGEFRSGMSQFVGYTPEEGYLGKDRVDILIEGRSPNGLPISARASIFIRIVSNDKRGDLLRNYSKQLSYIKQNCPAPAEFWKTDSKPVNGVLLTRQ